MNASSTPAASASGPRPLTDAVTEIRATDPGRIGRALAQRPRADLAGAGRLMVIACDHPARGALGAGERPLAMADREDLLRRCMTALSRPGVNGFLGTAEIIEDLTLLGALDGKLVWGSMNRIGLQGASFEMDDRFGAYDADGIEASHLDGGKMLTRINDADPASAATLEASAKAIDSLSERGLNAMIEPFISRWEDGRIVNDLSEEAVIRSICIAQAAGAQLGSHLAQAALRQRSRLDAARHGLHLPAQPHPGRRGLHRPRGHPRLLGGGPGASQRQGTGRGSLPALPGQ